MPIPQTPMQELYHVINTALGMVHMANHSSLFCPMTLRGGLGRRPAAPVAFPHLTYDVSAQLCLVQSKSPLVMSQVGVFHPQPCA